LDKVNRKFRATKPCQWWVADITYVATCLDSRWSGFAYVAFVGDGFSRTIVGWSVSLSRKTDMLPLQALNMAAWNVSDDLTGLIHHSDRGSNYVSLTYTDRIVELGGTPSVGSKGDSWDNALTESFFSALKNERVHRTVHAAKAQAKRDVIMYLEGFYNNRRRHSTLGYRRPNDVHYAYQQ
jgi:transposase InsO family protein